MCLALGGKIVQLLLFSLSLFSFMNILKRFAGIRWCDEPIVAACVQGEKVDSCSWNEKHLSKTPAPPPCPSDVYLFAHCFLFEQQSEIITASPEEMSYVVSIYRPRCEKVFLGTTDFWINSSVPSASGKHLFARETKFKINFAHTYHGTRCDFSEDLELRCV